MSNHLPECIYTPENIDPDKGIRWGGSPCICNRLRACEQRVANKIAALLVEGIDWQDGFAAGLDAAQDAVAAISAHSTWPDMSYNDGLIDALAAIDALKEET
jgi:hypothetical protein